MFTIVASPIEAQIARGLLVSAGIPAHVGDEQIALANWEWRLAIGGAKLRVASEQAERARAILRAMEAGEYALDDMPAEFELSAPDRETGSSRIAWLALMLLNIPLPWLRRDTREDAAGRSYNGKRSGDAGAACAIEMQQQKRNRRRRHDAPNQELTDPTVNAP